MSIAQEQFIERTEQLLKKLVNAAKEGGGSGKPPYATTQQIAAEKTFTFDSKTLLTNPGQYDLVSTQIEILLLDTDTGSPTNGLYINPEASVTWGIGTDGVIRVHNYRPEAVTVKIYVYPPLVKN